MKKYEFHLCICRLHQPTVYTHNLQLTLKEAKELFTNIITNDPNVVMCDVFYYNYYGLRCLCQYNNYNSFEDDGKYFKDNEDEDEPPYPESSTQEEYEETCRMWLNSEGQLYQDMGD